MVTLGEVEKAIVKAWRVHWHLPNPRALLEVGKVARPRVTWILAVVPVCKWSWLPCVCPCVPVACVTCVYRGV